MNYYQESNPPPQKYAIYDMNGDAIPELIIRTRITLDIYWIYDNELIPWHFNVHYAKPLNNMALLYERAGGAPEHTDYMYIVLGYQGEELYCIEFSKYANETQDPEYDYKYFINNTEVTKDTFNSLSELLLSIGDDKIEWKPFPF